MEVTKKRKNERSLIPLVIIIGLVCAPLIFILGIVVGSEIQVSSVLTADSLSSWVSAVATVAIAVLTFILAKETWYLREAQIEQVNNLRKENIRPNVSVTLQPSNISLNLMMVDVSNLGKGIARNISFKFIDRNGNRVVKNDNVIVDTFLNLHIFSDGIHSLGIRQKIESFLFNFLELNNDDFLTHFFTIEVSYSDVEGNIYTSELTIDFAEFKGITEIGGGDPLHKMAGDLEKLRKVIEQMTTSSKKLNVNTYTAKDRDIQTQAIKKSHAEFLQKNTK